MWPFYLFTWDCNANKAINIRCWLGRTLMPLYFPSQNLWFLLSFYWPLSEEIKYYPRLESFFILLMYTFKIQYKITIPIINKRYCFCDHVLYFYYPSSYWCIIFVFVLGREFFLSAKTLNFYSFPCLFWFITWSLIKDMYQV